MLSRSIQQNITLNFTIIDNDSEIDYQYGHTSNNFLSIIQYNIKMTVNDYANICKATPLFVLKPNNIKEIQSILLTNNKSSHPLKICIAGSKFSHGGHTMLNNAIYIDMKNINEIILHNNKTITVGAGATWEQIQNFLDKFNLSVAEMQSFRNFSVGGSISVNCHGRGLKYGTLSDTIVNMNVMASNGKIYSASRKDNLDLFRATIGGYGSIAIILSATLLIENNYNVERTVTTVKISEIDDVFCNLNKQKNLIFYNGNIFPGYGDKLTNTYWSCTNREPTITDRLRKKKKYHLLNMYMEHVLRVYKITKYIRPLLQSKITKKPLVCKRNYEMSYHTNELKPLMKWPSTRILQEYFVPVLHIGWFVKEMMNIFKIYNVNALNISLRYVKKTNIPLLNYAKIDCIAVVLYLNVYPNKLNKTQKWTRILINKSLQIDGSYYLPYLPLASVAQFLSSAKLIQIIKNY